MKACEWASCEVEPIKREDGWHFCHDHLTEHRLLRQEGAIRWQIEAAKANRRWLPNSALTREQLLLDLERELCRPVPPVLPVQRVDNGVDNSAAERGNPLLSRLSA